jgi:MFS family permease
MTSETLAPDRVAVPRRAGERPAHAAPARARRYRRPDAFTAMWSAASLSYAGDGVILAAAPLAAASLTSDPRLIAGLTVAATLPWALFSLVSGAVVDRVDRIRLMRRIDVIRAAVMAVPAAALLLDWPFLIPLLYVSFFVLGTAETFFANAAQSALPSVVPASRLRSANGKMQSAELILVQLAGPPMGGLLFAVAAALPFVFDSASFLLSAALLLLVRRPRDVVTPTAPAVPLRTQIAEGLAWIWRHVPLRYLALFTGLVNLLTEATLSILVLFTVHELGVGTAGFGYLLAIAALGGVLAGVVGPALTNRFDDRLLLLGVLAIQSITQLIVFLTDSFLVVAAALGLAAFGIVVWNIITISLRQAIVPDHLLGRVNSVYRLVAWGTIPIGAAGGGLLAAAIGVRAVFGVSALLLGGVTVLALFVLGAVSGRHVRTQRSKPEALGS